MHSPYAGAAGILLHLNGNFTMVKLNTLDKVITLKVLRSPPRLGKPLWNINVTNDHEYVPLVVSTSGPFLIHDLSPGL
jgi:hypothetical protein